MSWSHYVKRGADDLVVRPFEPCSTAAEIVIDTCGEADVTLVDVFTKLAASDATFGLRIAQGKAAQVRADGAWVNLDPVLDTGPMLVRELLISEHPERPNLWLVNYTATGFGPMVTVAEQPVPLGEPNISVQTASRPRTANAYRVDDPAGTVALTVPTDVVDSSVDPPVFQESAWKTGADIGGLKVDVNTSPLGVPIDQTVITITWIARHPYQQWDGSYDSRRNLTASDAYVGGRNSCEFLQYPVGSLLCESIDVQPLHHEYKLVTFVCVYDEWHHAQQVPLTAAQFYTPTFIDPTTGMSQALTVFWQQTFFDTWCIDSNSGILGAAELAYLERFEAAP